jgi:2-iminobutanoate/2-iminopropanoate deaminase
MTLKTIATDKAPAAVGPYSQAIKAGSLLFCSGQIALDPATMTMKGATAAEQTDQVFANLSAVLDAANLTLAHVIKTTVFLKDMNDFQAMNAVYEKHFGRHKPARATVEVARLPKDALVEIECIAVAAKLRTE